MFANVLHVIDTCYIQADVLMPKTRLGFAANETGDGDQTTKTAIFHDDVRG